MKKTKTGWLLTDKEVNVIEQSYTINRAIAEGKKLITSIYRRMDYCPKAEVLTTDWNGILCRILEGEEAQEIQYYHTDLSSIT